MDNVEMEHEYGYVRDEKIYLKGFLGFEDRKIGQVKESPATSLKYFEDRFHIAKQKVYALEQSIIEAQNKGSYLMKLIHMRTYLSNFDGLGNYTILFAKLDELEAGLRALISVNRVKNQEIKTALLQEAEDLLNAEDLNVATEQIKEVKQKWIKTGAVLEDQQEFVENKFNDLYRQFFEHKKEVLKGRSRQIKQNVQLYRRIISKAEEIKMSDDFEKTFQQFRDLQNDWKNGGKVPHKKAVELWEKFKSINDYFFNRFKAFKAYKDEYPELTPEQIRVQEERKLTLEAEALVDLHKEMPNNSDRAKELLMEWKKLSTVFRNFDEDLAERFRISCDKVFEISYLFRVVKRKYPDVETKPLEDQLRIKISFMRELIRKDENEIQLAESNLFKVRNDHNVGLYRKLEGNLNIQKRKVGVKKYVLHDFEDILNENKKHY
jgi:hypothetical protein